MNPDESKDLELPLVQLSDAEIAQELYRYLVLVLESERATLPPVVLGPN